MEIEYIKVNGTVYDIHDPNGGGSSDELWKPTVDSSGNISWQKSTSPVIPTPQNIKGQPGVNGSDGVSPGVTITTITGGHRVTITDAAHPTGQSFDVMDGQGGSGGGTYVFTATVDGSQNLFLQNGVTVQNVYDAFTAGKQVICYINGGIYTLTGGFALSDGTINMTFECRTLGAKTSSHTVSTAVFASNATTGNGFYTYRYGVDSWNYSPTSKTSAMTKPVGLDRDYGTLWTTP